MLSNTGSTESVVKYVVYRRRQPAGNLVVITAILFYWLTLKQQLTGTVDRPISDRSAVGHDPGEFNGIIPQPCPVYSVSFMNHDNGSNRCLAVL